MFDQLKLENQLCFRLYTAARLTMQAYFPYFEPLASPIRSIWYCWCCGRKTINR